MGRFDILKENTFTSSSSNNNSNANRNNSRNKDNNRNNNSNANRNNSRNKDNNRNNSRNKDNNRNNSRNNNRNKDSTINSSTISNSSRDNNWTNNLFKQKEKEKKEYFIEENEELFPELVIQDENVKENNNNIESQWLEIAEKEAENDIKCNHISINNDPKYWKGSHWIGNMLIRSKKTNERCDNNLNKYKKSYLEENQYNEYNQRITSSRVEYSRDGDKWYNNWDATFSKKQLEAMNDENNNKMINRWSKWIENDYEKRRLESEEHYNDTGEINNFMIAEQEMLEYEEYEKQLEYEDECLEDDESSEDDYV